MDTYYKPQFTIMQSNEKLQTIWEIFSLKEFKVSDFSNIAFIYVATSGILSTVNLILILYIYIQLIASTLTISAITLLCLFIYILYYI